jgi:hypothetical protein
MRRARGKRKSDFGFFSSAESTDGKGYKKIVAGTTIVRALKTKPKPL